MKEKEKIRELYLLIILHVIINCLSSLIKYLPSNNSTNIRGIAVKELECILHPSSSHLNITPTFGRKEKWKNGDKRMNEGQDEKKSSIFCREGKWKERKGGRIENSSHSLQNNPSNIKLMFVGGRI